MDVQLWVGDKVGRDRLSIIFMELTEIPHRLVS